MLSVKSLPKTFDKFIDLLDQSYPLRLPDPKQSDREIWIAVGERRVIENLRALQKERDEDLLENS